MPDLPHLTAEEQAIAYKLQHGMVLTAEDSHLLRQDTLLLLKRLSAARGALQLSRDICMGAQPLSHTAIALIDAALTEARDGS